MKLNLQIIKFRKLWFVLSGLVLAAGIVAIVQSFMTFGAPVKLGLDFTGGTKLEYKFYSARPEAVEGEEALDPVHAAGKQTLKKELNSEELQTLLSDLDLEGSSVQVTKDEDPTLIIRTRAISDDPISDKLNAKLKQDYGDFEILAIDTVSPVIGPELLTGGLVALLVTILGIIVYISVRFKADYAMCAIAALFHDVFIVMGLFAFLGIQYGIEVNSLFITAILTVFGFSVHDTIVVFDRVRENQKLQTREFGFDQVADLSINQVAVRSLNTSITTLTVLGFLFFLGGASTTLFVGAMFVGMLVGTYSSLFVASPLLVMLRSSQRAVTPSKSGAKASNNSKPKSSKKKAKAAR